MRKLQFAMVALFAALLAACATGYHDTRMVNTQTGAEKEPQGPYQSLVVGVLVEHELRAHLENAIVAKFAEQGIQATAAHTVFGDKGIEGKSRDYLAQRMKENGFDSALAIHLEEQRTETLEVKGDPGTAVPVAGTMTMRPQVFSDDFFVNEDIYVVRLDLWDVDQQAIIWQGNTVSFNTGGFKGLEKGAGHFAQVITNAIGKADIF
ncbi:MAG: hypothetical protein CL539_03920 [Alcanivorax sp.]|jgi:hypothetical protein|uniref:hypothetical protein n=1 Tax=Alcanivorax TaxID=59753 RepID=UPI000C64D5C3|nr:MULTISPECIES: hypothetical protein [Alcanivorax]MAC13811.1 hypothetical protein [Alcanivorax sp.]MBG33753.1 hypothetical protein [Alcanivorax sp.]MDF1636223.1 hypothetical protein [Alcanivorax jadensis]|tara:strand:+ start:2840 stop:3460 length:621 start_codon:yes stop_codon:yes gene_type:complete